MTKIYSLVFLICIALSSNNLQAQTPCTNGYAGTYPCSNMDLVAFVPLSEIGGGSNTSDIWGWVSPVTGKEYALVGVNNGTAFLDISVPTAPVYLGMLPTHTVNSLWRDIETFNNYCFIVSEANNHGLQVFDLMQLDNVTNPPVAFEETEHYNGFGHCHTLNIDVQTGYCYCNGTNTYEGGLHIVDINDPLNPTLAGGFSLDGYTHDCFAWSYDGPDPNFAGKQVVLACNEDELTIVDVTDKSDCQAVASYSYDNVGYIHQGWISKDKRYFFVDDELDEGDLSNAGTPSGTRTHLFDLNSLTEGVYMGFYESDSPSIDHNLYVLDQFIYESNYRSGVRVLDAVHIADGTLSEVGFFDLYPANDFIQYSGTWSNYPYLPSRLNLATHMYEGFYIIKPTLINLSQYSFDLCGADQLVMQVEVNADLAFPLTFAIEGIPNVSVSADPLTAPGLATVTISDLLAAGSGMYQVNLALQTTFGQQYEVPFTITLSNGAPVAPVLLNLPDNSLVSNTATSIVFEWVADENATSYIFELATDAAFTTIVEAQNTTLNTFLINYNLPDGVYYWRVKAINECGSGQWSTAFQFNLTIVSVNEIPTTNLKVYPNPANETLYIHGSLAGTTIVINDMSGRMVKSFVTNNSGIYSLDISDLETGMYIMHANADAVRWVKK